jgi:AcrR family transcriptional regulator
LKQRSQATPMDRKRTARRRISQQEREQMIVQGAVSFFAEHGFEGQTRELARRLGITQPLLYRYFPDKATLIDRVYQEVFLDPWNQQWQTWIVDRSRPLLERLTCFYQDYARVILRYEWVRLFMFSGLRGLDIAKRYVEVVFARIFPCVIGEVRSAQGGLPLAESPMTDAEAEHLWALHGAIFQLGIRRWIYRLPVPADQDAAVAARVAAFLDGAPGAMRAAAPSAKGWNPRVEAATQ